MTYDAKQANVIEELMNALGPLPSSNVARLRMSGLVAWDPDKVPEDYRRLITVKHTWVAYVTKRQVEKNPDLLKHFTGFDPSVAWADVETGRIFFDRQDGIERIDRAAIHHNGTTYSVPRPGRHHDVARMMVEKHGLDVDAQRVQGFTTMDGRFVEREEAARIARAAGQVDETKKTNPKDVLFSEDLW